MRLKEARKRRNLKQAQVADYLGIPLRTYQNYEREVNDPDSFILCKLADFYDVTTDYLLELTDIPNSIGQYHLKREEYELVSLYRRMYAVNDEQARLVREAFARRLSGENVNSIAVDFARRGVRSYTGKPCGATLVGNMLRNEKYTGVYKFGDVRIPGGMPEIIDKETFSAVQRVRSRKVRNEEEWGSFPLSGRAICAGCGRNLMGVSGRGRHHVKYEYYRCKGKDCIVKPVRADWLDGAIAEALRAIIDDPIRVAEVARAVESAMQLGSGSESLQKAARKRVSDGKSGIEKLVDAISKGLDPALATDKIAELQAQVDAAERELSLIEKTQEFDTDEFIEYLQHGATLDDKTLLDALVYQVIVGERDILVVLNFDAINAEPATIDLQRVRANCVWLPVEHSERIGKVSMTLVPRAILLRFSRVA